MTPEVSPGTLSNTEAGAIHNRAQELILPRTPSH
jgi:hypothetical protein